MTLLPEQDYDKPHHDQGCNPERPLPHPDPLTDVQADHDPLHGTGSLVVRQPSPLVIPWACSSSSTIAIYFNSTA